MLYVVLLSRLEVVVCVGVVVSGCILDGYRIVSMVWYGVWHSGRWLRVCRCY